MLDSRIIFLYVLCILVSIAIISTLLSLRDRNSYEKLDPRRNILFKRALVWRFGSLIFSVIVLIIFLKLGGASLLNYVSQQMGKINLAGLALSPTEIASIILAGILFAIMGYLLATSNGK